MTINDHLHSIAAAAKEQSTGLAEGSTAIHQVTQQNAALVEEASAPTHKLWSEAGGLADIIPSSSYKTAHAACGRCRPWPQQRPSLITEKNFDPNAESIKSTAVASNAAAVSFT